MAIVIQQPVCGSSVDGSQAINVTWTDDQASQFYWIRVTSEAAVGIQFNGSFYHTSGIIQPGTTSYTFDAVGFPGGCTTQWLSIAYFDGSAWSVEQCEVEFCVPADVICETGQALEPSNPTDPIDNGPLDLVGCANVSSGQPIDISTNRWQQSPPITTLHPWSFADTLTNPERYDVTEAESFTNDPNYTQPPCGGAVWQFPFVEGELASKQGFFPISGTNKYARVAYWAKLPTFVRSSTDNAVFGSVISYKWGAGFFPCRTNPPSGYGNTVAGRPNGTNGWSVRDQAFGGGFSIPPQPSPGKHYLMSYVYHTDQINQYGDEFYSVDFPVDEWFYFEKLVCLNDVNQNNGYIKTWVNGNQIDNITGINFTNDPALLSVNRFSIVWYHGGSISAPSDAFGYMADFKWAVGDDALLDCTVTGIDDDLPECKDRLKAISPVDGNYTITLNCGGSEVQTCRLRVGECLANTYYTSGVILPEMLANGKN